MDRERRLEHHETGQNAKKSGEWKLIDTLLLVLMVTLVGSMGSIGITEHAFAEETEMMIMDFSNEPENVIYLVGGCLWDIEHLMASIPSVYYTNDSAKATVERIADLERSRSPEFYVEIGPLLNYYPAEAYHQDYLANNPFDCCYILKEEIKLFSFLSIDSGDYQKPAAEVIRDMLTEEQNHVTQESGTEYPFRNEF